MNGRKSDTAILSYEKSVKADGEKYALYNFRTKNYTKRELMNMVNELLEYSIILQKQIEPTKVRITSTYIMRIRWK